MIMGVPSSAKKQYYKQMKYKGILEEALKIKVRDDFFPNYNSTIIGKVDFCITLKDNDGSSSLPFGEGWGGASLLWAEAKTGNYDIFAMFAQLILTIGIARTFDKYLPPTFLGAFDATKIVFIPYNAVVDIFSLNDFNWNVTPSNHETKEFLLIKDRIEKSLDQNYYLYDYIKDDCELRFFIKNNLAKATESGKILIDKNNFVPIYLRWLDQVKPHIDFNWEEAKKLNIQDNLFYLADLFVDDKGTSSIDDDTPTNENLFVVFRNSGYEISKENLKSLFNANIKIKDRKAYEQFWKKYKRPPINEFQDYIRDRIDLLVSQDIRERKGAFFTPKEWVWLSQQYIADTLGKNWQDDYYIWDCAAGTGNLLAGLTNSFNIFASTLDQSDVNIIHDRIENGALLLKDNCFQFDFLNDDFSKLPQNLQDIINDPEKRKKLIIYINPPYAEHLDIKNISLAESNTNKSGIKFTKIDSKYKEKYGSKASRELFIQFFIRVNEEIPDAILGTFSKIKFINSSNFIKFRESFKSKFIKGFICPSNTFDNVKGSFPIGFSVWRLNNESNFKSLYFDVFNEKTEKIGKKLVHIPSGEKKFLSMNDWIKKNNFPIDKINLGYLNCSSQEFLHQKYTGITVYKQNSAYKQLPLSNLNLIQSSVYFSVTFNIDGTWTNDRDQFLYPKDGWEKDKEFHNDCLAYTLFHGQNRISSKDGTNHWIPFTEQEVRPRRKFESNFMTDFIAGKISPTNLSEGEAFQQKMFESKAVTPPSGGGGLTFSAKATAVFDAGRELWKYYHQVIGKLSQSESEGLVNASLYDIREYFQGRNQNGRMNNKSQDENYNNLINQLRKTLKILANKIEPKVYEYEFLKN